MGATRRDQQPADIPLLKTEFALLRRSAPTHMKAERRHELKHNELAEWLGEWLEAYRPHATGISIGALVLVVIVLASLWLISGSRQSAATAWTEYFRALNDREPAKALEQVASSQVGNQAAWWALLSVADMNLAEGSALLHSDRAEAQKFLEKAERTYKQLLTSSDPQMQTLAELGLARVYEALCKPAEALPYYQRVAEREKDSAFGSMARTAVQRLNDQREVAFLEWFAKQTPRRPAPLPGVGGAIPGLPTDLPGRPDLTLPGLDAPGASESSETSPPAAQPSTSPSPPASSQLPATPEASTLPPSTSAQPPAPPSPSTKPSNAPPSDDNRPPSSGSSPPTPGVPPQPPAPPDPEKPAEAPSPSP